MSMCLPPPGNHASRGTGDLWSKSVLLILAILTYSKDDSAKGSHAGTGNHKLGGGTRWWHQRWTTLGGGTEWWPGWWTEVRWWHRVVARLVDQG